MLLILVMLLNGVCSGEASTNVGPPVLRTKMNIILESLRNLSIGAPTLDPSDDPWIPLDDRIEIGLKRYEATTSSAVRMLDSICQKEDEQAEALQLSSYPNIQGFFEELQETSKVLPSPWRINIVKDGIHTISSETCHQLTIPLPPTQREATKIGPCSAGTVACTRRRNWNRSEIAKVTHKLTLDAAERADHAMTKWSGVSSTSGPDLQPVIKGIAMEVWQSNEESSLLLLATLLLTDWSLDVAVSHLITQEASLDARVNALETDYQQSTPSPGLVEIDSREPYTHDLEGYNKRINNLEARWERFFLINNETFHRLESLLEDSEPNEESSGLSMEPINDPMDLEAWRMLCNSFTRSIDISLDRKKRSEDSNASSILENTPTEKTKEHGIAKKVSQIYNKFSKTFYTPMDKCVPCWTIVSSIIVTSVFLILHSLAICILCLKFKTISKRTRECIEMVEPNGDTPNSRTSGRRQRIASSKAGNPKNTKRSVTYKMLPTVDP